MPLIARFVTMVLVVNAVAFSQTAEQNALFTRGIYAYREARYAEATESFKRLADSAPNNPVVLLYLGTAYATEHVPGAKAPQNLELGRNAVAAFRKALELAPDNKL